MSITKAFITAIVFISFSLCMVDQVIAAGPPGPPGGGGNPPCWPAPCVPIDGGISFLIAAGLAYGGKKVHQRLKDKKP